MAPAVLPIPSNRGQARSARGRLRRRHGNIIDNTAVGIPRLERKREGRYFALSAPPAAVFLHSARNFLRSLPLSPLASASFEHSREAAVRGFSAFFSGGALVS